MTRKREYGIVVDRATILEWPQIEALRVAYFEKWNQPVQRRTDDVAWYVARIGERVVGCYSTVMSEGQRWALDFYVTDDRYGTIAAYAMASAIAREADADGVDVVCMVHPDNAPQHKETKAHGYAPIGVLYLRKPGG